jgi:hypothetical protein
MCAARGEAVDLKPPFYPQIPIKNGQNARLASTRSYKNNSKIKSQKTKHGQFQQPIPALP